MRRRKRICKVIAVLLLHCSAAGAQELLTEPLATAVPANAVEDDTGEHLQVPQADEWFFQPEAPTVPPSEDDAMELHVQHVIAGELAGLGSDAVRGDFPLETLLLADEDPATEPRTTPEEIIYQQPIAQPPMSTEEYYAQISTGQPLPTGTPLPISSYNATAAEAAKRPYPCWFVLGIVHDVNANGVPYPEKEVERFRNACKKIVAEHCKNPYPISRNGTIETRPECFHDAANPEDISRRTYECAIQDHSQLDPAKISHKCNCGALVVHCGHLQKADEYCSIAKRCHDALVEVGGKYHYISLGCGDINVLTEIKKQLKLEGTFECNQTFVPQGLTLKDRHCRVKWTCTAKGVATETYPDCTSELLQSCHRHGDAVYCMEGAKKVRKLCCLDPKSDNGHSFRTDDSLNQDMTCKPGPLTFIGRLSCATFRDNNVPCFDPKQPEQPLCWDDPFILNEQPKQLVCCSSPVPGVGVYRVGSC